MLQSTQMDDIKKSRLSHLLNLLISLGISGIYIFYNTYFTNKWFAMSIFCIGVLLVFITFLLIFKVFQWSGIKNGTVIMNNGIYKKESSYADISLWIVVLLLVFAPSLKSYFDFALLGLLAGICVKNLLFLLIEVPQLKTLSFHYDKTQKNL